MKVLMGQKFALKLVTDKALYLQHPSSSKLAEIDNQLPLVKSNEAFHFKMPPRLNFVIN